MFENKENRLSRSEAARYLGITSNTLRDLPIAYIQYRKGGRVLYRKQDLDNFIKKSRHNYKTTH